MEFLILEHDDCLRRRVQRKPDGIAPLSHDLGEKESVDGYRLFAQVDVFDVGSHIVVEGIAANEGETVMGDGNRLLVVEVHVEDRIMDGYQFGGKGERQALVEIDQLYIRFALLDEIFQ